MVDTKAEYDIRLLAQQLGTNYRSLMYWIRGERPIPAYLLPRICTLLNNYEALDCLESESGRVAFKIPEPHLTSEKELLAVSHLIREVGEALESPLAQRLSNRVSHDQRANQSSAANRHSQHDAKVRPCMKAQAAADERPEGHAMECGDSSPLSAGDLSPSKLHTPPSCCEPLGRGSAWPTSRPGEESGDKSQHSKKQRNRCCTVRPNFHFIHDDDRDYLLDSTTVCEA